MLLAPKNRWLSKADSKEEIAYELFGKKINPMVTPEPGRNKFTLELTSTVRIASNSVIDGTTPTTTIQSTVSNRKDPSSAISISSDHVVSSNRLAIALEATDNVILLGLSDNEGSDDDDDDPLFKSMIAADELQPHGDDNDFDSMGRDDDNAVVNDTNIHASSIIAEPDLDKTQSSLEGLERSAYDLEHWLEDMVSER